ncbi:PRC-barrel domain-containing protein [Aceticella autotrophica]|uniref:PRC-barrel domain-containing protein n=1 Tax=Aceticella autotrophica TaxID=2755338 RepID=A0A975AUD0_9THEO|nr:PRC-barrel domain-containing protein [Aceticella autotrophica]QSZ26552.1 PRC-barrel domain-containing protein [Aceticella autotrophica]
MIFLKNIIGMPIVSLQDKTTLGEINNILYKNINEKIIGILIDEEGFLKNPKIIYNDDIIDINKKIFIRNSESIFDIDKSKALLDIINGKYNILDKDVYDLKNNFYGKVYDLILDEKMRTINYIEISKGFLTDLMNGLKLIKTKDLDIIEDKIILRNPTFFTRGGIKNLL